MSEDFDRAAARLPEFDLPEATRQRHLEMLVSLARDENKRRSRTKRLRMAIGAGALAAIVAGTAGAWSLGAFDAPVRDRGTAHCYTTADLSRSDNYTNFFVAVPPGSPDPVGDAAEQAMQICVGQWQRGRFSTTTPTFPDSATGPATHPAPSLVACVLDNGQVAIFPGTKETCVGLGLGNAVL